MSKVLAALRKRLGVLLVLLGALAVAGVGYFDTYPTYFAKNVILSEVECGQVAVLVSVHQFKLQTPDEVLPEAVVKAMESPTRLAKRVAKYIIDKGTIPPNVPPNMLYVGIYQSCMMSEGHAELK